MEPSAVTTVAILLAAGGGTRFAAATHKLLAPLAGRAVYLHALDHVREARIGPVVVVTGAAPLDLPTADDVLAVHNAGWAEGQATSLHAGLVVAEQLGATYAVVGLADQPGVPPAAWQAIAEAPPTWNVVVASYDGRRGPNPVRLHRSVWPELPVHGDEGARPLMRRRPELVHEISCPGTAHDIDTLEDLQRWTSS